MKLSSAPHSRGDSTIDIVIGWYSDSYVVRLRGCVVGWLIDLAGYFLLQPIELLISYPNPRARRHLAEGRKINSEKSWKIPTTIYLLPVKLGRKLSHQSWERECYRVRSKKTCCVLINWNTWYVCMFDLTILIYAYDSWTRYIRHVCISVDIVSASGLGSQGLYRVRNRFMFIRIVWKHPCASPVKHVLLHWSI